MTKPYIILDIDSTLMNIDHRLHHILKKPNNWKLFRAKVDEDKVFQITQHIILGLGLYYNTIILTGRSEMHMDQTIEVLNNLKITYSRIFMRKLNDYSNSVDYKESIYLNEIKDKYNIQAVFDDHPEVIEMFRKYNIPCFRPYLSKYTYELDGEYDLGKAE